MFQIYDGREYFYQWDKDRKLIVMDGSIKEVHFCNRTEDCSLRREVYEDGELHLVNVPNILLQDNYKINVYGYDGNYTKQSTTFTVKARSKPDDYIYTEEELKEWEELEARIKALEESEVEVDLTGYATEEFVNANLTIKPLPIKEKKLYSTSSRYYVDLEELESITPYGLGEIPEEEKGLLGLICFCIYAEDGTRKQIAMLQKNTVVSFFRNGDFEYSLLPIMPVGINAEYVINVTDKTTANNITFTTIRNRDFLGINNNQAFTPENDYQPATKKYVDDNAGGALSISETNVFGGNVDNDSIMGEYNFTFGDGALADATCATAFGKETIANSDFAFAINYQTEASGKASFAAGNNTVASGDYSAVFGAGMEVSGNNSFATGLDSVVDGKCSTAFGEGLTAEGDYQTVVGINNIADSDKLFIVGNGSLGDNEFNSNAFTVDSNGNAWFSGEVTIGADEKKLATLDDINNAIAALRAELAAT